LKHIGALQFAFCVNFSGAYSQRSEPPFQQDLSFNQVKTHPYKKEQQTAQAQQKPKDDASILGNFKSDLIIVSARGGY